MYELVQVSESCFYIQSPAKIGLVKLGGDQVCLIDSGSDRDAGRKARQVLDAIGSPNLQIILDPVNLLDENNAADHRAVIQEAIELLGEDVAVIHLKDFQVQDGKIVSVGAGMGEMDYTGVMQFIKKEKPYIHATLENTRPDNAVAARLFVQKQWEQA